MGIQSALRRRTQPTGTSAGPDLLLRGRRTGPTFTVLGVGLVVLVVLSFPLGRFSVPAGTVLEVLASRVVPMDATWTPAVETVVTQIRLPRILGALLIGAALSASGAAYQSMFRNPLVSPAILGVSAGAGFGAALGILLHTPWWTVQILAFAFGLVATLISVGIGKTLGDGSLVVLVLAGMVVSALFQAFISLTQYVANPDDTLPAITFWLMGGLGKIHMDDLLLPAVLSLVCLAALWALRWPITVLAAGDDEARTLGVNRALVWTVVIGSATVLTADAVSLAGIIGWVGLIVPHAARMIVGPGFDRLLPASVLLGAGFLLVVDDVARTASAVELPLGILTAVIGAPCFLVLLARSRRQWV